MHIYIYMYTYVAFYTFPPSNHYTKQEFTVLCCPVLVGRCGVREALMLEAQETSDWESLQRQQRNLGG